MAGAEDEAADEVGKGDVGCRRNGPAAMNVLENAKDERKAKIDRNGTKHPSRLDREFGRKQWGDEGYAEEELVAELGAAFLCADLELALQPREDHASYIAHWLTVLQNDKRAIFRAAAHAQRAADHLHALQPSIQEAA